MNEDRLSHPIFTPLLLQFQTPMVITLKAKITQWIYCGIKGGVILADSRTGKTTSIEMIKDGIRTRNGNGFIKTHSMSMGSYDRPTKLNCLREIYASTRQPLSSSTNVNRIVQQIVHFFCDIASHNEDRKVVFFVDEFHLFSIDQMDAFAKIHNELRDNKVTLYTYFFGSTEEGLTLVEKSTAKNRAHIRGRFFKSLYYLQGIENKDDLRKCLKQYDKTRYPADGPTYTEYFLPEDYGKGWRLENLTDLIWSYYNAVKLRHNFKSWAMEDFVGTINPLLTDYFPKYGVNKFNRNMFDRCVEVSGMIPDSLEGVS